MVRRGVRREAGLGTRSSERTAGPTTFSVRGGMTAPHLASTSNSALILIAPRPHIPHGLTPLRTAGPDRVTITPTRNRPLPPDHPPSVHRQFPTGRHERLPIRRPAEVRRSLVRAEASNQASRDNGLRPGPASVERHLLTVGPQIKSYTLHGECRVSRLIPCTRGCLSCPMRHLVNEVHGHSHGHTAGCKPERPGCLEPMTERGREDGPARL